MRMHYCRSSTNENAGYRLIFVWQVSLQSDGRYGGLDENTGLWSGMIGSVIRGSADLAVADITQTAMRETVVDFTVPFDQVGEQNLLSSEWSTSLSPYYQRVFLLVHYGIRAPIIYLYNQ